MAAAVMTDDTTMDLHQFGAYTDLIGIGPLFRLIIEFCIVYRVLLRRRPSPRRVMYIAAKPP